MGAFTEIPKGTRFGMLTFIERVRVDGTLLCRMKCDCGNETIIPTGRLTRNRSCGCVKHRTGTEAIAYKHGHATTNRRRSPTLSVWSNMIDRCRRDTHHEWHNYGGRGIGYCERWSEFNNFLQDMGVRPGLDYTLERIDNEKGYSPENCRWATRKEQMRNTRINRLVDVDGTFFCNAEAAEIIGVTRGRMTLLVKKGYKITKSNKDFLQTVQTNGRMITFNGKTQCLTQWAKELGINYRRLHSRFKRGWSVERAFTEH